MRGSKGVYGMRKLMWGVILSGVVGGVGCVSLPVVPTVRRAVGGWPSALDLDAKLQSAPLAPDQNIRIDELGRDQHMSHHLVQLRDREQPHIHAKHDLTVVLLRGQGILVVEKSPVVMRIGDVVVIPQGTPHYFVNQGALPAVGYVIFAPPFDGRDSVETPSPLEPSPLEHTP